MTTSNTSALSQIPTLGSGLGYRRGIRDAIFAARDQIDVLEVTTEQFFSTPAELKELEEIAEQFAVVPHGTSMSVGTAGELDWDYLRMVKRVSDLTESPYYSDHLAITRVAGINFGHLSPLWFTEDTLATVIRNVSTIQDFLLKPLVLETIAYFFKIPGSTMTEGEFFTRLVDATGCGVLLDLLNVHINATNHHFDPVEFLDAMPLHAVVQIHLAGGYWQDGVYVDEHAERVNEPTWNLLDTVAQQVPIRVSILEQDWNLPSKIDPMLDDVARSRRVIQAASVNSTGSYVTAGSGDLS